MSQPTPTPAAHAPAPRTRDPATPVAAREAASATSEPALREHLRRMRELRPGLHLHADDAHDAADFTAHGEMGEALRIVLLLEGSLDVSYGSQRVTLSTHDGGRPAARAILVSVNEPDRFTRRARSGRYARRVSLGLGREWIAQAAGEGASRPLHDFMRSHLALRQWRASERAVAIAEQMVRPPALEPLLQNLYLETRALELVAEAFGVVAGPAAAPAPAESHGLRPREFQRMRELREFLAGDQADELSLDEIARHAGINANTLQRHFRAMFGTTVFEFMRDSRLQRARQALERDGVTVAQAALLAGYTSPANFATAYKRRFGLVPKLARSRL